MKIVNSKKSSGLDGHVNVRVHKVADLALHFYIDHSHVLSVIFEDEEYQQNCSENIVEIGKSRKKRGIYISQHFCPPEILKILTGDETNDIALLKQVFDCFLNVYLANNTNYAFTKQSYQKMLERFFVHPQMIQNMGKGADLTDYFMDLPDGYKPYDDT